MTSANNLASVGDDLSRRRCKLRARVDAGGGRLRCPVPNIVRPWFSKCPSGGVSSAVNCVPFQTPYTPHQFLGHLWWMSSGLLESAAPAMGVSGHVERLAVPGGQQQVNNVMLREILATAGTRMADSTGNRFEGSTAADEVHQPFSIDAVSRDTGKEDLPGDTDDLNQDFGDTLDDEGSTDRDSPTQNQQNSSRDVEPSSEVKNNYLRSPERGERAPSPLEGDKKGRLENIVSGMLRTNETISQIPINGCKKRKLYQPMQHESHAEDHDEEEADHAAMEEDNDKPLQIDMNQNSTVDQDGKSLQLKPSHLALMHERYSRLYKSNGYGFIGQIGGGRQTQQCEIDLSVRSTGITTPEVISPQKSSEADRPVSALHKINEENSTNGTFMEYARRVLSADHRNKENESSNAKYIHNEIKSQIHGQSSSDVGELADSLKNEIISSLSGIIDGVISKWMNKRRSTSDQSKTEQIATKLNLHDQQPREQQYSPRTEILRRISQHNGRFSNSASLELAADHFAAYNLAQIRPQISAAHLNRKTDESESDMLAAAASALSRAGSYGANNSLQVLRDSMQNQNQTEQEDGPLSLVMTPRKKRHKITDARPFARNNLSRALSDELATHQTVTSSSSPSPNSFGSTPSSLLPEPMAASVALTNPAMSQNFAGYPAFYKSSFSPLMSGEHRIGGSPSMQHPLHYHPASQHPAGLLHSAAMMAAAAGAASQNSPDSMSYYRETSDRSDVNSTDGVYETFQGSIGLSGKFDASEASATLTPMHLRKAKLMFFWSRYPTSSILKSYFPDINFNKNNTAQLVKWFSNFREFFYIQMEKYARQALSEGVKCCEELCVRKDSELLRVLNLHYNRNNHSEIPAGFPFVAEAALREFFKAIQTGRDAEPSWKKSIYKVIARLDDTIPEIFRSARLLEQLE